ncbi:MAG TPA: hypothetical protein VLG11_04035 [Candidatus Saccharimonadales bacterium]|nr:hypothetical protein [Candidatus Saccharimonadales bacterium]
MVQPGEGAPDLSPPITEVQFTDAQQERRRALISDFATAQDVRLEIAEITPAQIDAEFANFDTYFAVAQREVGDTLEPSALKAARIILDAIRSGGSCADIVQATSGVRLGEYHGRNLLLGMLVSGKKLVEQQESRPESAAPAAKNSEARTGLSHDRGKTVRRVGGLAGGSWADTGEPGFSRQAGVSKRRARPQRRQLSNAGLGPRIAELFGADSDTAVMLRMYHGVDGERLKFNAIAEEFSLNPDEVRSIIQSATFQLLGEDSPE